MEWLLIVALVLLIPCVLMPVFLLWYLHRRGVTLSIKVAREKRRKPVTVAETEAEAAEYEELLLADLKRYFETHPPVLE